MIRQLLIENFRCLRAVTLSLEPLTVFVGANSSGKSSVFSALHAEFGSDDRWMRRAKSEVRVTVTMDDNSTESRVLDQRGRFSKSTKFPASQVLQLDLNAVRETNRVSEMRSLSPNGFGLANVFATLTRAEQGQVAQQFCDLVPMFADVNVRPQSDGNHWILFQDRWEPKLWYQPQQVSDGSMLLLTFLLLPYQAPHDVVAIEEPERGLHPYLMGRLIGVLRKLSKGEIGPRAIQILLATHSAGLLEFVEPAEVRFFSRSKETGETRVEAPPLDDPRWLKALEEYDNSMGDLWLSGGLGGVPGR